MFCSNCGKEIPNNAKFCNFCGTAVTQNAQTAQSANSYTQPQSYAAPQQSYTAPQQTYTAPQYSAPAPKKKSGGGVIVSIVIVAVVAILGYVVGYGLIGGGFSKEPAYEEPSVEIIEPSVSIEDFPSPEYMAIFNERGIIDERTVFIDLESDSFVMAEEGGAVDKQEFGYSDDIVREMVETIYYPLEGMTEAEISAFETEAKAVFAEADELDFINVFYERFGSYYIITVSMFDLDNPETLQIVNDMGILYVTPGTNAVSMSLTETELLAMGYVKR